MSATIMAAAELNTNLTNVLILYPSENSKKARNGLSWLDMGKATTA